MINYDLIVATHREYVALQHKLELLDSFNRGPRFGQLWINGDTIELSREDYNDVVAILRAKFAKKMAEIGEKPLDKFVVEYEKLYKHGKRITDNIR